MNVLSSILEFIANNLGVTENKASSSVSINANSFARLTINVSKSGYTPIGVLALVKTGETSGYCLISNFGFDASKTTLNVDVVNVHTIRATASVTATILYHKSY